MHPLSLTAFCLVLLAAFAPAASAAPDAAGPALASARDRGASLTLTIYPVARPFNKPTQYAEDADGAEAMALLLENAGLNAIGVAREPAGLPDPTTLDTTSTVRAFQEAVRRRPPTTEAALFVQLISEPAKFKPRVLRGVLLDRSGGLLWAVELTHADSLWRQHPPDCPLTASHLVALALKQALALPGDPGQPRREGHWNRYWNEKMKQRRPAGASPSTR